VIFYFLYSWLFCAVFFHIAWGITDKKKNVTSVDALWAFAIAFLSCVHAYNADGDLSRRILVSACISFWGFRLAFHIWRDRVLKGVEDSRYGQFRKNWGTKARRNFWFVFQIQALTVVAFAAALWPSFVSKESFGSWLDFLGIFIWAISISGEALADRQLKEFKSKKTGKTMQSGLWKYSRHPNYFFEWIHWFAYICWAWGSGWEALACLGPLLMLWLLTKVSGIPGTEEQSLRSRGDEYRDYQRRTSAFIPWVPRKGGSS